MARFLDSRFFERKTRNEFADEIPQHFKDRHPWTAIGRTLTVAMVLALSFASAKPARAGRLAADTIALFPKDIGEFAYADLKKARTLKWFPQLQEQMLPGSLQAIRAIPGIRRRGPQLTSRRTRMGPGS